MKSTILTTLSRRQALSRIVGLASPIYGLYMLWQIVPFFRGQITSPLVSAYNAISPLGIQLIGSWDVALNGTHSGLGGFCGYYFVGVGGFLTAAAFVMLTGGAVSRVLLVGWTQFSNEQREARNAEQEAARVEATRERRRERRLAGVRSTAGKSDGCEWLVVLGAALFVWFL